MADQEDECILFLREQRSNPSNFCVLKFGVTENAVSWPSPEEVKKNLDRFSMEVYTSVQQHLVEEDDDSTKPIRDLCNYYLELLSDEARAEEMEDLENKAIKAKDNTDESFSIVELTEEMQLLLSKVADRRTTMEKDVREIAGTSIRQLAAVTFWETRKWELSKQDLRYLLEQKKRFVITGLDELTMGSRGDISDLERSLKEEVLKLQGKGPDEQIPLRTGSESGLSVSSESARARVEMLRTTVTNAESYLESTKETSEAAVDFRRIEAMKANVCQCVKSMEKSVNRGLQLAPAEAGSLMPSSAEGIRPQLS